jgi:hypothetical protein
VVATHHMPNHICCPELRIGAGEYSGEQASKTPDLESEP